MNVFIVFGLLNKSIPLLPVDNTYVLTSANCVSGVNRAGWQVLVGEQNTARANETTYTRKSIIKNVIPHEAYDASSFANDIALVRTDIALNNNVGIVCLPWTLSKELFPSANVVAAGWGASTSGGQLSNILQKVSLKTMANADCEGKTQTDVTSSKICTFSSGNDTCDKDSGASLYYTNPSNQRVYSIGVIGANKECGGTQPTIHTRITSYLNWIKKNAVGAKFCSV